LDPEKSVSIGVAAHITAASEHGPRYDASLTVEELRAMKARAEEAALEALERRVEEQPANVRAALRKASSLMPELLQEMRNDLREQPLARTLLLLKKAWSYWNDGSTLEYYFETHEDLTRKMGVLENLGLIRDIAFNDVARYKISEELADYLQAGEVPPARTVGAEHPVTSLWKPWACGANRRQVFICAPSVATMASERP
jgi:hypothetical protein